MAADTPQALMDKAGFDDSIDRPTFEQILEMDDDEDESFSRSIVEGFFEQAENTFENMDDALDKEDLKNLSQLGHFLKGSSATLGLTHIKNSCEKIQHLGHGMDEAGVLELDHDTCLKRIRVEVVILRKDYTKVKAILQKFYPQNDA